MKRLINSFDHKNIPNIGTVCYLAPRQWGHYQKRPTFWQWRKARPDLEVSIIYGVFIGNADPTWSHGHATGLKVTNGDRTKFYWGGMGNVYWDGLLVLRPILAEWEHGLDFRQWHYPDLVMFDPFYGCNSGWKQLRSYEEIIAECKARLKNI